MYGTCAENNVAPLRQHKDKDAECYDDEQPMSISLGVMLGGIIDGLSISIDDAKKLTRH